MFRYINSPQEIATPHQLIDALDLINEVQKDTINPCFKFNVSSISSKNVRISSGAIILSPDMSRLVMEGIKWAISSTVLKESIALKQQHS